MIVPGVQASGLVLGEPEEEFRPDYIYDVVDFGVGVSPESGVVRVTRTAKFTSLSGETSLLLVALPQKPVEIISAGVSCPGEGFNPPVVISVEYTKGLTSAGVVPIRLERNIKRYETCKVVMEYVENAPASFNNYVEVDVEAEEETEIAFSEFTFTPVTEVRVQELKVSMALPREWHVDSVRPFASVSSGYRRTTVAWKRMGWGPGESVPFFLRMTSRAQEETNSLPILSTLLFAGLLLGVITIVASKREIGDVWERRGGRLAQAYEKTTWAMRFSETIPLAMKNLTRKKGRTFLTFAGVAIAGSMLASQALTVALSAQDAAGVAVEGYLYAVVAIALGVSFFAVGSTTFTAVQERRGEVGLMKAMGFSGGWVMRLFVVEAILLGFVAAIVGGLIGALSAVAPYTEMSLSWGVVWVFIAFDLGMVIMIVTFAYAKTRAHITVGALVASALPVLGIVAQISIVSSFPLSFLLTMGILGACLVFILIVSLLGSVFPASMAARLYPVEALR